MTDRFVIKGLGSRRALSGSIAVNGAKNAALKACAAAFLFKDTVTLKNVPDIEDIRRSVELLTELGVTVDKKGTSYTMTIPKEASTIFSPDISGQFRASIVSTGPVLARYGRVSFPHPGGCVLGARPIDLFLDGYEKMGATVKHKKNYYEIEAPQGGLKGATLFFKNISVGATETFMMAAVLAKGKTILKNAAVEPEIEHLAAFLNSCGAKIKGAGTHTIEITGTKLLQNKKPYVTVPDRLEAGSFLILGALAAQDLEITRCQPAHLESLIETLRAAGVSIETGKSTIRVAASSSYKATHIKTHEYPGFPTDLQAPMAVFLTQAKGESLIFETIFEGRLQYTQELLRMGMDVTMYDPHRVMIKGPTPLRSKVLESPDIRAGLAFIIAAIIAKGESVIHNVYKVDRGYERIEERLRKIGVDIERIKS